MSEVACREMNWWENYPYHKIWCNDACPLVPRFHYRNGDEWNANNWSVHWLIFNIWSLEHFSFQFDGGISPHELYIGLILPYLRITIGFRHTYYNWQYKINKLLTRKPALRNEKGEYN